MSARKIRLGVAGLGRAFTLMLPTFAADPRIALAGASDLRADARQRFAADFDALTHETIEDLCAQSDLDVIYVATPHQMHAAHTLHAARHGKHVLVEKPMAITLSECDAMIEAAREAGIHIVVGHSHSFNAPVLHARALIDGGDFGAVRMIHAMNYTDYMVRPRRPEELDTARGGGVMFSQAAHQIDIVRLLGGGLVRSVRAATGNWDPARPTEGAYSALLTFEDGAFASCSYNGYAHFDSDEYQGWIGEMGTSKDPTRYGILRRQLNSASGLGDEAAMKAARNYGGKDYVPSASATTDRHHQHFGPVVVSCDRADIRPGPKGVTIYADDAVRFTPTPLPEIARSEVIDELYAAVVNGRPPLHDGEWSRATLEVCLAMLASARTQSDVMLQRQVALSGRRA
jgi:phthalate 4,5-cis-dihydrodiol dehydrogenase